MEGKEGKEWGRVRMKNKEEGLGEREGRVGERTKVETRLNQFLPTPLVFANVLFDILLCGMTFHGRRQHYNHIMPVYRSAREVITASVTGGLSINRMEPTVVVGPKTPTTQQGQGRTNDKIHVFNLEVWRLLCTAKTI